MVGIQAVSHAELSWKDLLGGGAAGMVIFVVVIFLRSIAEMRKEHSDTVAKVSSDFSDAVRSATKEFADSTQKIIEGARQHNQANLGMLQQIISDLREAK
ncbi:MAG: hypothetical protein ACK5S6_01385 [bacterium]|jgi:hypothetical protein